LLLDEATAHLDLSHREDLLRRVRAFTRDGGAALVVLHDLDLAVRHCERIAVLREGALVAMGIPEVALRAEVLDQVFGVDAEIVHDASGPALRTYGARGARGRNGAPS
jgi:iron complex transport system ATP-binding protein